MTDVPPVIGHRGAMGHAPENTVASLEKAAAMGVGWVEVDAKLTRDNEVVLLHDERLDRTTDGRGPVATADWAEIKTLDAGSWFAPAFAGARVPTLAEAIAAMARLGLGANIEIKPCLGREPETGDAVARVLAACWPATLPPPLLSSVAPSALAAARAVAPDMDRALLVGAVPDDWVELAAALDCHALHCDETYVAEAQARHVVAATRYPVRCYTINDSARAAELFSWGVQSVFTDFPDRIPM